MDSELQDITSDYKSKITPVVESLVQNLSPQKIILFSRKVDLTGEISSFKLCIITETADKAKTELDSYLFTDSLIPFDILIYTPEEWRHLTTLHTSFARRIAENGVVLYEQ